MSIVHSSAYNECVVYVLYMIYNYASTFYPQHAILAVDVSCQHMLAVTLYNLDSFVFSDESIIWFPGAFLNLRSQHIVQHID